MAIQPRMHISTMSKRKEMRWRISWMATTNSFFFTFNINLLGAYYRVFFFWMWWCTKHHKLCVIFFLHWIIVVGPEVTKNGLIGTHEPKGYRGRSLSLLFCASPSNTQIPRLFYDRHTRNDRSMVVDAMIHPQYSEILELTGQME